LALAGAALAQTIVLAQDGRSGALAVSSTVGVTETLTDNVRLSSSEKQADLISQLSAGFRLSTRSGRIQGSLDYTLTGYSYARGRGSSNLQNTLNAAGKAELIENWMSIDAVAQIGQQAVSAFGQQSIDPGLVNNNRTEVRSVQVSPSVRGSISGQIDYRASLSLASTRSGATDGLGNEDTSSASVSIGSSKAAAFGWTASMTRSHANYDASRSTDQESANLSLSYVPMSNWRLTGSFGRESTNLASQDKTANATWGLGADWSPSSNVRLNGQLDHRFFGNGHRVSFEYRLPRSVFKLSSSRDINDGTTQGSAAKLGTAYDLFNTVFASIEPDPGKRDSLVRNYLQQYGVSPTALVAAGFLASSATLERRTDVSYAIQGVRSTVTASFFGTTSSRLDRQSTGVDDLSGSGQVRQRGYGLTFGHRLNPQTGMSLDLSRQSTSEASSSRISSMQSITLNLTTTFGERSTGSLAARHASFGSTTQPYTENAVIATFGLRF
jgi:uncharacterized protein (PEP-CTERM system associated)